MFCIFSIKLCHSLLELPDRGDSGDRQLYSFVESMNDGSNKGPQHIYYVEFMLSPRCLDIPYLP